jgi:hypothetical protein
MPPKKHPSPEMLHDLQQVFKQHNWSGKPVGLTAAASDTACPAGTSPKEVTYQLPDGTWVTKTICV